MTKKSVLIRMDPFAVETLDLIATRSKQGGGNESRASLIRVAVDFWISANVRDEWPTMPFMKRLHDDWRAEVEAAIDLTPDDGDFS